MVNCFRSYVIGYICGVEYVKGIAWVEGLPSPRALVHCNDKFSAYWVRSCIVAMSTVV